MNVPEGAVWSPPKLAHGPQGTELEGRNRYFTENRNPVSDEDDHLTAKLVVVVPEAGDTATGTLMVPVIGVGSEFMEA